MIIHEYGDRSKPHILLLHGMNMNHTSLLPYFDSFKETHHIITPDFTGHGEDMGSFISEGAALTRVKGVEWIFFNGMKKLRDDPKLITKMYKDIDNSEKELMEQLFASIKRTDDKALKNMVHTCNSFEYEKCPLSEQAQCRMFFEFGSRDSHILAKGLIRRFYPKATIIVRKGHGHCTYPAKHREEYPDILREYMKKAL